MNYYKVKNFGISVTFHNELVEYISESKYFLFLYDLEEQNFASVSKDYAFFKIYQNGIYYCRCKFKTLKNIYLKEILKCVGKDLSVGRSVLDLN